MTFEAAQKVADAVLYEGYVLYPYHASSDKNRVRFQFGVVAPMDFSLSDGSEAWEMQSECLVATAGDARIDVRIRFLQLQARAVEAADATADSGFVPVPSLEVSGEELVAWDEAVERQIEEANLSLADLCRTEQAIPFSIDGGREVEYATGPGGDLTGRVVRTRWAIDGLLRMSAERFDGLVRLRVRIENRTSSPPGVSGRDEALRRSLLGCHTLIAVTDGSFLSLIDPPPEAEVVAKGCVNLHTWPVLVGEAGSDDLLLSSPIILYDYPEIAPESQGDLFDATEIDEILTLRVMTMTDEEKADARGTDPRAAAILDRCDTMSDRSLGLLHGARRDDDVPWWDADQDARADPEADVVLVAGTAVSKGSRVLLRPSRRADAQDIFLAGLTAVVARVYFDVDGNTHVAVALEDDPGADLYGATGRFYYFSPDELEPLPARQDAR